jgi:hypothetical protein
MRRNKTWVKTMQLIVEYVTVKNHSIDSHSSYKSVQILSLIALYIILEVQLWFILMRSFFCSLTSDRTPSLTLSCMFQAFTDSNLNSFWIFAFFCRPIPLHRICQHVQVTAIKNRFQFTKDGS